MADTAAAQLRRVLMLIPQFADDEEQPKDQLVARAGTTRDRLHAELVELWTAGQLARLRGAVRARRVVRLRYRAGSANTSSERTVQPHAVVYVEHMWYLVSTGDNWTLLLFRLDRIEQVDVLDERFELDGTVLDRVLRAGRAFESDTDRRMTVRYVPRIARWLAEREGKPLSADGSLTLEHPVADEAWAMRHVLQYGPDAEVIGPPTLRALVATQLSAMA